MSQSKKLMTVKIFRVQILCICLLIMHVDLLKKKNENKYLMFDDSVNENKELLKNAKMFGIELKTKSKQMVVKKMIIEKITRKLNLTLTMTCH